MDSPGAIEVLAISASIEREFSNSARSQAWTRELHRVFCMQGGDTDVSYARNSEASACAIALSKPLLTEAISTTKLFHGQELITIADLVCATGYNTVSTVEFIVDILKQRCRAELSSVPEFEASFSDLPSNDFNSLFQLLFPSFDIAKRPYFVAAVPGSFYGRLFPSRKLHVAVCMNSLHWLSQIPEAVLDRESPAWNKGRVWIDGAKEEVVEAYAKQSQDDLEEFLQCRKAEIKEGGVLFLLMAGRPSLQRPEKQFNDEDTRLNHPFTIIEQAWEDLINERWINEETRDIFNIPAYMRSMEEVKSAFDKCTGFGIISIECMKLIEHSRQKQENMSRGRISYARAKANLVRSGLRPLIEAQLGVEFTEKLFNRFEKRVSENINTVRMTCFYGLIVVSAIRN